MYVKQSRRKDGRTYLVLAKSWHDPKSGISKTITVKSLGFLDELEKGYDDPVAFFKAEAKRLTLTEKEDNQPILLKIDKNAVLTVDNDNRRNLGFVVLSRIFHDLRLDDFFLTKQRYANFDFNALSIAKLLIYGRLLLPASKQATWLQRTFFFEKFQFSLENVYRFLSFLSRFTEELPLYLHQQIQQRYARNTEMVYYDVTNYYFEIDEPDNLRKPGYSKEHRRDPIVQMGLFMDTNGIPITYRLFPGNTADSQTVIPLLSTIQNHYGIGRVIVVADKGVISGDTIYYALSAKNGYLFSYSVRGADDEFKQYVLSQTDYQDVTGKPIFPEDGEEDGKDCDFKIKSRLYPREIQVTMTNGKKKKRTVHEKQLVIWSKKYADRARKERADAIAKARELIDNPTKFNQSTAYGAAKYVRNLKFDSKTGEIIDAQDKRLLNEEKIRQEEQFDGYYALVTSEYQMSDQQMLDLYRGLWQIEETFRITKSDLEARPVYLSREDRIQAHFLICFVALLLGRILEKSMQDKYSLPAILKSLAKANGTLTEQNLYVFNYLNQILLDIGAKYDIDFRLKYRQIGEIRKLIGDTKK
jgi:transposase